MPRKGEDYNYRKCRNMPLLEGTKDWEERVRLMSGKRGHENVM